MATSGTKTFNLDVAGIVEEALQRCGGDPISGDEAASARRSLNLLLTFLTIDNSPLNTQKEMSVDTVANTASYNLDDSILNIRNCVLVDPLTGNDIELSRENIQEYNTSYKGRPNTGKPTSFFIERTRDRLVMKLFPKPDAVYTLRMWVSTKLEDITAATETLDIPTMYLPAICSGLAYYCSLKRRNIPTDYRQELKTLYTTELSAALKEDRFREDMIIVPGNN